MARINAMDQIIFELLPPPINWRAKKIDEWIIHVNSILSKHGISHLCIPEVVNESRDQERKVPFVAKMDNVDFIALMRASASHFTFIPYKICVRVSRSEFEAWIQKIYDQGMRHVVLVGGEHSEIIYPGYSVNEAIHYVKNKFPDMLVGAIVIFTRKNEVTRIIKKVKYGADFFVSQIIFETDNMQQVILSLEKACQLFSLNFPRLYISIAPASSARDIDFMAWLGVEFPSAVHSYVCEGGDEIVAKRTLEVLERLLEEAERFMQHEHMRLGLNIEHVMYGNLDLAEELLSSAQKRIGP